MKKSREKLFGKTDGNWYGSDDEAGLTNIGSGPYNMSSGGIQRKGRMHYEKHYMQHCRYP